MNPVQKDGTPNKRALAACACCRSRRTKCVMHNGTTPCDYCQRHSLECVIADDDRKRPTSKAYITSLQSRIQVLESLLEKSNGAPSPPPPNLKVESAAARAGSSKPQVEKPLRSSKETLLLSQDVASKISSRHNSHGEKPYPATVTSRTVPQISVPASQSGSEEDITSTVHTGFSDNSTKATKESLYSELEKPQNELTLIITNLTAMIGEDPTLITSKGFLETAKYDIELHQWYNHLPKVLKWRVAPEIDLPTEYYLLHQQYHTALISLHRRFAFPNQRGRCAESEDSIQSGLMASISRSVCIESAIRISRIVDECQKRRKLNRAVCATLQHVGIAATILVISISYHEDAQARLQGFNNLQNLIQTLEVMTESYSHVGSMTNILSAQYRSMIASPTTLPQEDLLRDFDFLLKPQDENATGPVPELEAFEAFHAAGGNPPLVHNGLTLQYPNPANQNEGLGSPADAWEGAPGMAPKGNTLVTLFGSWEMDNQTHLFDELHMGSATGQEIEGYTF